MKFRLGRVEAKRLCDSSVCRVKWLFIFYANEIGFAKEL